MNDKIIAIISSNVEGKCRTGLAYAMNALKYEWMADVKIYLFDPAEVLVTKHKELQALLSEFQLMEGQVIACKAIADRHEVRELGSEVEYIGVRQYKRRVYTDGVVISKLGQRKIVSNY